MKRSTLIVTLALAAAATLVWRQLGTRDGGAPLPGRPTDDEPAPRVGSGEAAALLARERALAHFGRGEFAAARAALAPLLAGTAPAREDIVRQALIDFADRGKVDPAPALARLRALDADDSHLAYVEARLALEEGELERAVARFRAVLARTPSDRASRFGLAVTLDSLGEFEPARELLDGLVAEGIEHGGVWYVQAVYRLMMVSRELGLDEAAERLGVVHAALKAQGLVPEDMTLIDRGDLAQLTPPHGSAAGRAPAPARPALQLQAEPVALPELGGQTFLSADDLDGDGDVDLLTAGPRGVVAAFRAADTWSVEVVTDTPATLARAFDLGNADRIDLWVVAGGEALLFEARSGSDLVFAAPGAARWSRSPLVLPAGPGAVRDLVVVDFDHDGDLDTLLVGDAGARLWRNDGAAPRVDEATGETLRGGFVDASREAGLPQIGEFTWCDIEDLDGDHDVDLVLGGPDRTLLLDSLRAGRFIDVAGARLAGMPPSATRPLLADLDADGRPDLFFAARPTELLRQAADGAFAATPLVAALGGGTAALEADLDLDGRVDLIVGGGTGLASIVRGINSTNPTVTAFPHEGAPVTALAATDLDGDLDEDLAALTAAGLIVSRSVTPSGRGARLELVGFKDNRRAVGAVIEARSGDAYRRTFWRGEARLIGCGAADAVDVIRTTWPNGATQSMLAVPPTARPFLDAPEGGLVQSSSLIGSCPFLYSWNGARFEFVSDVLGVTPLGLPMAPGVLVPPDHDEHVLVRGDQLVPNADGELVLQFTEELREVTYLDHLRLAAVDHPREVEVFPNERFTFPPFPEEHLHTLREPIAPSRAIGSDGADWTAALAAVDDVHAAPFEPLAGQFLGLATPHTIELEFPAERVRDAARLRLVCTGWFFWTDASVNMASARTPGIEFLPPLFEVPDGQGGWRPIGPPPGFPAGKSKTMVVDLGDALDRARPRLRLRSTLRLYWDSLRLAVDEDDTRITRTPLALTGARLYARGFSRPAPSDRPDLPERFVWEELEPAPRWDQHPGRYTRYGEVAALLGTSDDRFVILGSGDALELRFDALPGAPPEGWTRDYVLYLDGWAKDRDPNTLEALEVEPLPFHGMSGYPYGPDERFPDTAEHRAWRAEWNTREARRWRAPLATAARAAWIREVLGR